MLRILITEISDTRRHVLHKFLAGGQYEITIANSFESAIQFLQVSKESDERYAAIVLGWPDFTDPLADELLDLLLQPDRQTLPALILTENIDASKRDWVTKRRNTGILTWDNHPELLDSLNKLITTKQDKKIPAPPLPAGSASNEIRILFVDDSTTVRATYRRLLINNGYITDTANSVKEAMDKASNQHYDIVITDYFMPDGNGDELCRLLRNNPNTVNSAIAIITGTYLDQVIKDSLYAGATECMFKNEVDELFLARVAAMSRTVHIQNSIEKERQRLEGILSSVGEGVYGVDATGIITFINPMAKNILGYLDDTTIIGQSAHSLFHYADKNGKKITKNSCKIQDAYRSGSTIEKSEVVFWHKSGHPIVVEYTIVPLNIAGKLEGSVIAFEDISQRKILEKELLWQANHDTLTRLHNRFYFEKELDKELKYVKRNNTLSALLYLDLDRFKYINDTAGHTAGDRLLIEISQLLQSRSRESDLLARIGGDEFAIILRNIENDNILPVAEDIRTIMQEYDFQYAGKNYKVNCSIGISSLDKNVSSTDESLANADLACNIAKRKGRNQTHIYHPGGDDKVAMDLELGWSAKLRNALANDEFLIYYQPIVPLIEIDSQSLPEHDGDLWKQIQNNNTMAKSRYEVLIRLPGPDGEIISPNAFLPTAERFNMMREIDYWVLSKAMEELAKCNLKHKNISFSINLSGHTMDDDSLPSMIKNFITLYNIDPNSLIFEITETAAIANMDAARKFISEISSLGCHFALDDFGSGFSSFSHLKHLDVDYIKIDGQFVQNIEKNAEDRSIVTSINDIAHSLGKQTIAEYVESPGILKLLKRCGVDYAQGFYISPPLPDLNELTQPDSDKVVHYDFQTRK